MKSLKQQLKEAGYKATESKKFKIFHILSGTYLMEYCEKTTKTQLATSNTKGRAGQIIDSYRLGKGTGKTNCGKTIEKFYYLEEDISITHPLFIKYDTLKVRAINREKPLTKNEFEIIEIEDDK
jgi:hypothetical protein